VAGTGAPINQNSRAAIGVFVAVATVATIPLSAFATIFGLIIACYDDYNSTLCSSDTGNWAVVASIGLPILLVLGGGVLGLSRRRWTFAILGAVLAAVAMFAVFVAAIGYAESR
jgi:hypothetical protein